MITDFNVYNFVRNFLPLGWRLQTTVDFCSCLVRPLYDLQTPIFDTFWSESVRLSKATGQIISLENNLQLQFGANIYISNVENSAPGFIVGAGNDTATVGAGSDNTYFVGVDYTGDTESTTDFIINVPNLLNVSENDIRAFTDKFNLAGQRYAVVYY